MVYPTTPPGECSRRDSNKKKTKKATNVESEQAESLNRKKKIGRPKMVHPLTGMERMRKNRLNLDKRAAAQQKQTEARRKKAAAESDEEKARRREEARLRKALSRQNQSRQKKQGERVADRNRKRKAKEASDQYNETNQQKMKKHRLTIRLNFQTPAKKRKIKNTSRMITKHLKSCSPKTKVKVMSQACNATLSPTSKAVLTDTISPPDTNDSVHVFNKLKKNRDKTSNCVRKLMLNQVVNESGSINIARKTFRDTLHYNSLYRAAKKDFDDIIIHYKTIKKSPKPVSVETRKIIISFYNRDDISRQLPYKNMTRKMKDESGKYHRVPVRVMEVTLKKAFQLFKQEHPGVKIGRRSFEIKRPKNVRLRRYAQRLQCCCTYHTNMGYILKACNYMLTLNGKETIPNNDALVSAAVCDSQSLPCIFRTCANCKSFPKIDELQIPSLKCTKACFQNNNECTKHTVKVKQFERVSYTHKEKEKKKMQLVDKHVTPHQLTELLKTKMDKFLHHRFNVEQTAKTYEQIIANLNENTIFKIHDFSENYTCLLPEEIQSIHWVQETATLYPIVVLRKVNNDIREDHITFISNDKTHDVAFVEYSNEILHKHYKDDGLSIEHDIEYNDGCASQFKCIRAFSSLARRPVKTTRVFCETSHGKSKSDGLGGVLKSYASRSVCGEQTVIRNAKELFDFLNETLAVKNDIESQKPMLNRLFFYICEEDLKAFRMALPEERYHSIPGTQQIHQIVTSPVTTTSVAYRKCSCACSHCLGGKFDECESREIFKKCKTSIEMKEHTFSISAAKQVPEKDLNEEEEVEYEEEWEWKETEAAQLIEKGDIAVIKTGDDYPYYLLKLTDPPFVTTDNVIDGYNHAFPANHRVVRGNYLEVQKEINDGSTLYYVDETRQAMVSAFCVVGNCPEPIQTSGKRRGKTVEMYIINADLHQALSELVNYE